jgi:hypothetical protein
MKKLAFVVVVLVLSLACSAQTPFQGTTVSFGLTPITLPTFGQTLAGMETDTLFHLTNNNVIGPTVLVSSDTFVGGRYNRIFPSVSTWLQKYTALTGNQFEVGWTASAGVVNASKEQWGARTGVFVNYAPSGSSTWDIGFEAQANYLPGIVTQGKWVQSFAVGPHFHF